MANSERAREALSATRALGIPDEDVKPVLKQLWRVFDKNWKPIEAEDYRALVDAYFEFKENKEVEDKKKGVMEHAVSKRPSKRPYLGAQEVQEDQASSTMDKSRQLLALEEDGMSMRPYGKGIMESSEPCLRDRRIESCSPLPYTQCGDKVKNSLSSHVASGDIKSTSGRASSAVYFKQPMDEPGSSQNSRENVPSYHRNRELIKPKTEQSINDLAHFAEPISMLPYSNTQALQRDH